MLNIFKSEKAWIYSLVMLWFIVQSLLFLIFGVRFMGDSKEYIKYAHNIINDFYFANNHQARYVCYPIFLAIVMFFGAGLKGVVIIQQILSGLSTILLYKSTKALSKNYIAPVVCCFLYIIWFDVQMLNGFILTESVFISFIILANYLIIRAKTIKGSMLVIPVIAVICLLRPNGFIVAVGYFGYLFTHAYFSIKSIKTRITLILITLAIPIAIIFIVDSYLLTSFTNVETYQRKQVIFDYDGLLVESDKEIIMPPQTASPLSKIWFFISHNTELFMKMTAWRFMLFWGNIKPYYSVLHNLFIVICLYPMYYFAGKTFISKSVDLPVRVFVLLILLQQCFIVSLTSEDFTGRFLMSFLSYILQFGSVGLSWFLLKSPFSRNLFNNA